MSRSGYADDSDDCENLQLWRGAVRRAIQGRRGQAFLRDLLKAMDALPEKRLIADELETEKGVCAIGSVGRMRGIDMNALDVHDWDMLGEKFGIARAMVQEIEYINDEHGQTPEHRFEAVRKWAEGQLLGTQDSRLHES